MNIHLKKILHLATHGYYQVIAWYKKQPKNKKIAIVIGAMLVLFVLVRIFTKGTVTDSTVKNIARQVEVSSVLSLSNNEKDFPLIGTVTSVSEATLRAESSGRLVKVYKKLGDSVYTGGVIAEFDNSGERASLLQAEGAYEQAKAARTIAGLTSGQSGTSLGETKNQALNSIGNAYTTIDDAVRGKTDTAFVDPKFQQVKLRLTIPDAVLSISLENKRRTIETVLTSREARNRTLTISNDLVEELTSVQNEVNTVKLYLDDLFTAYSKALPDETFSAATLENGKSNVQSARQAVSGVLTALIASRTALTASMTSAQVSGADGGSQTTGTLASADAQVKQALGVYNAALSRLEKTIIRSPITGTLNSLSINTGDYISAFTQVAVVSNNGALEVVSFVTEEDAKRIPVGSPVSVEGGIRGVVTRIAPAIDPVTKKIEVRIGIKDNAASLVNGQSVSVLIAKNKSQSKKDVKGPIVIPLSALKLTPQGAFVFSVSASSTLVAIPVKEGAILGEQIQILQGLTGSENIVIDARGLKDGVEVTIKTK